MSEKIIDPKTGGEAGVDPRKTTCPLAGFVVIPKQQGPVTVIGGRQMQNVEVEIRFGGCNPEVCRFHVGGFCRIERALDIALALADHFGLSKDA